MLAYRVAITVFAPVLALVFLWHLIRRRTSFSDINERLGGGVGTAGALWFHGASNGELTSGKALIQALSARFPDTAIIVTCNTTSGRELVQSWGIAKVTARLAPIDYRWILARFRKKWRPIALISLENEMWPNRIATSSFPVICIAARLSQRSASGWTKLSGMMRAMLGNITYLAPQDSNSADRFLMLGLQSTALGAPISLKSGVTLAKPDQTLVGEFSAIFSRRDTLLAASTHAGEDEIILAAFRDAKAQKPTLKLILAPRHPKRSAQIHDLITSLNLSVAIRSKSEPLTPGTDIYLVDTLGEMPVWYALAGMTFVGGSLVAKGGHTPFEPANADSMILHGPHLENFATAYAALTQDKAAILVETADALKTVLLETTASQQHAYARAAQTSLAQFDTAPDAVNTLSDTIKNLLR